MLMECTVLTYESLLLIILVDGLDSILLLYDSMSFSDSETVEETVTTLCDGPYIRYG